MSWIPRDPNAPLGAGNQYLLQVHLWVSIPDPFAGWLAGTIHNSLAGLGYKVDHVDVIGSVINIYLNG